jgi:hypothetical protein
MSKSQRPPATKKEETEETTKAKCPGPVHCNEARMGIQHVHVAALCACKGCSAEHKEGQQCEDPPTAMFGLIGSMAIKVCTECLCELAKRLMERGSL